MMRRMATYKLRRRGGELSLLLLTLEQKTVNIVYGGRWAILIDNASNLHGNTVDIRIILCLLRLQYQCVSNIHVNVFNVSSLYSNHCGH